MKVDGRARTRARVNRRSESILSEGVYGRWRRASPTIADAAGSRASASTIFIGLASFGEL